MADDKSDCTLTFVPPPTFGPVLFDNGCSYEGLPAFPDGAPPFYPLPVPPPPAVPQASLPAPPRPHGAAAPNPRFTYPNPEPAQAAAEVPTGFRYGHASDPGYPWEHPTVQAQNYPMPGSFFDASNVMGMYQFRDSMDLARYLLGSALAMAGVSTQWATGYDSTSVTYQEQMRQILEDFSEWNQRLYALEDGTIDWRPHHANNFKRMAEGQPPIRTINLIGETLPEFAAAGHRPIVWAPAVSLDALREAVPRLQVLQWSDGVPTTEPPPAIRALGMDTQGLKVPCNAAVGARQWWEEQLR